ncbi:MAG: serine/threonine-protein kinase [Dehalococcoidia bacterium]
MQSVDLSGRTLGSVELIAPLGQGGMSAVYRGIQRSLDRVVAVKVLPPSLQQDPTFLDRFRREATAIARLEHPHVLTVHDFGEERGVAYLVLELAGGGNLRDAAGGQPLAPSVVLTLVDQVASALDYAHDRGIIHRDVKPSNILLRSAGGDPLVAPWSKLADFGLAKLLESETTLTGSGVGVGTPEYMSPEQAQGLAVDRRTDVYALGVLAYELLTGAPPYQGATPLSVVLQHIGAPVPSARKARPVLPRTIDQVLRRALAKTPDERYPTAGSFAVALRSAVEIVPAATSPNVDRRLLLAGGAAIAGLAGLSAIGMALWSGPPALPRPGPPPGDRFRETFAAIRDRIGPPAEPQRPIRMAEQEFQRGSVLVLLDPPGVYQISGKSSGAWERPIERLAGFEWPADRPPSPLAIRDRILQNLPAVQDTLGAPAAAGEITPAAPYQRFQRGFLVGRRAPETYALLDDGGFFSFR